MSLKHYAYLGDAVWELYIREKTILQTKNSKELHKITIAKVKAEFQHDLLLKLQNELTEEEHELVRRGRNLTVPIARKSNQSEYRMATAFEVLIGWLYQQNLKRLEEIENFLEQFL